ncbi:hypothetical protein SUGI_0001890 [Cryptomeria japonica]|uniref:proteinaceous RNase P 1, chloroplastic/mitochondrial n=1 Tax=Cryptomeria japonica TaxID=3369 RepID=UPI002408967B|nr:proteinaceous RNase P 1, chloroplastic/mitochondrial [Cryptomeria japonica]GLJ04718.1 hypothetical protein SUGI_0001890 [Cryptomeria japonica]
MVGKYIANIVRTSHLLNRSLSFTFTLVRPKNCFPKQNNLILERNLHVLSTQYTVLCRLSQQKHKLFPRNICSDIQNVTADGGKKKKRSKDREQGQLKYELDMCSKRGDLMEALNIYDSTKKRGIDLKQHHYNVLLYLCSSAAMGMLRPSDAAKLDKGLEEVAEISDEVRHLALRRGFEIYEQMSLDKIAPNETTFTAAARLAMAKNDGNLAFELVKRMAENNIPPRLRSYGPALSAFCKENKADMAYEVDDHMTASGVQAEEPELGMLMKVSVQSFREEKVYSLLHRLRSSVRQVSRDTAYVIEKWFKNGEAGKLGVPTWDRAKIRDALIAGGGGWHGQGWLGQGNWTVEHAAIDHKGVCRVCGEKLVTIDIDPLETENFAKSVGSLACERESKSFESFQEWLEKHGPFDAIVDGANVGLYKDATFNYSRLNNIAIGIQQRSPSKKFPLIIIHNRRSKGGLADNPRNKQVIEKWRKSGALYTTPTGSNDDWYWLYAAVRFKSLIVTNDEMRDHLFELLGSSFFPIWKERHQVKFSGTSRNPQFHMPPPFSIVIQESETGSWHIPIMGGDDIETPRDWLCITRCKSNVSQERVSESNTQLTDFKHIGAQEANRDICGVEETKILRSANGNDTALNSFNKSFKSKTRKKDTKEQRSSPLSPRKSLHPRKIRKEQNLLH